jgi:undecaprenyl-diphosphatase
MQPSSSEPASAPRNFLRAAWLLAPVGVVLAIAGWLVHATAANTSWMLAVHAQAPGEAAAWVWSSLTVVGLGLSALVLLLLADRGDGRLAALLPFTFLFGGLLTHVPKHLLAHPRPASTAIAPHLHVIGQTFTGPVSMPSGHAVTAAAAAALLCVVVARGWAARAGVVLVAAAIAWSRVVVGAHWPSDVLVGAGVGLLTAALVLACAGAQATGAWYAWLTARVRTVAGQRWLAAGEVVVAGALLSQNTGYPAGQPMLWLLAVAGVASAARRWATSSQRGAAAAAVDAQSEPL